MNDYQKELKFRIDYRLLQDEWEPAPWLNLGDWSETCDYRQACKNFAMRLGLFAEIGNCESILELGCGYGAGLRVWEEEFEIKKCDALEPDKGCIDFIQNSPPKCLGRLFKSQFEELLDLYHVEKPDLKVQYDAILCVDSAYFFPLSNLIDFARNRLKKEGRLAFHYLTVNADAEPSKIMKKILFKGGVIAEEMLDEIELKNALLNRGWKQVKIENMTNQVLGGFPEFVRRRAPFLKITQNLSPSWIRILLTAWFCRKVLAEGSFSYIMICAIRSE